MHKSYFLYKKLIKLYSQDYIGQEIKSFYTQHKNEFVLETNKASLVIGFDSRLPFLVSRADYYRKSQSMDLYENIISEKIQSFKIINNYRIIEIRLSKFRIYLNLFHTRPGLSIYLAEEELASYKNSIDKNLLIPCNIEENQHFYKRLNDERESRGISFDKFLLEIENSKLLYEYSVLGKKIISLIRLEEYDEFLDKKYDDISYGYSVFIYRAINNERFKDLYKRTEINLKKNKKIILTTLKNLESVKYDEREKQEFEEIGHLILANKHLIKPGDTELICTNWYSPGQEPLRIKLRANKTFHENAEFYYHKSKAFELNRKELGVRKEIFTKKKLKLEELEKEFYKIKTFKELERYKNKLLRVGLLEAENNKEKRIMKDRKFNASELEIDGELVFVGKDAKSNDYLSIKFAKANDYWFHVQGSPGSHIILKWHGRKEKPGKSLIEKVASLAAYHSKQKNAGTVPVIYTMAKFVRKPKGAAPGAVTVSQEKSVFVKPKAYEELI